MVGAIIWFPLFYFVLPRLIGGLTELISLGVGVAAIFTGLGALIGWWAGHLAVGAIIGGAIGFLLVSLP